MKTVRVGLIGCGFAAGLHLGGYKRVYGVQVTLAAVASDQPREIVERFARENRVEKIFADYRELLADPAIDVVDICTPPFLHEEMVIESLRAGKHVICEKPLTGFFEAADGRDRVGHTVAKCEMYRTVLERLENIRRAAEQCDRQFMYAENWVYAPVVQKSAELIAARGSKVLFMHAEESHNGSHAFHAANWKHTGGGALIRQGCHPISAVLYLKQVEARARGERIAAQSVLADVGVCTAALGPQERRHIDAAPVDVEDIANLTITFTDGTKAHVFSGDMVVGGMRNRIDVYTGDAVHHCNMSPNDTMTAYHAEEAGLEDIYFAEKLGTRQGWQFVGVGEEIARGYAGEMQDFMECAAENRGPLSDFRIAYDTARVLYAAYQSAEEDTRVVLEQTVDTGGQVTSERGVAI